ncbi:hypothetical protein [Nocardia amikacinitolerans]|uniref:hypothetical protein n=1 Tax=Nocardia amikacinitolerans TaxID=756689 RepID=UPI0020A3D988|nr:hypothetical protein [Nocardia amikacinitolerans]MCP2290864.1 hypothetical protein [Nocardia amikacinitolerans]
MRRDQLEHAIRAACQIIGRPEVIVVGSQAILGTFEETRLPADATMSLAIDILPIADDNDETSRLCAFREKDQNFVAALLESGLVAPRVIAERLPTVSERYEPAIDRGLGWIRSWL